MAMLVCCSYSCASCCNPSAGAHCAHQIVTVLPTSVPALPWAAAEAAPAASALLLSCLQLKPTADTAMLNRMAVGTRMGVPLVVRFAMMPGFFRAFCSWARCDRVYRNRSSAARLPAPGRRGALDGVEHFLILHAVLEIRGRQSLGNDGIDQVINGVREAVLVANDVTSGPPSFQVRVLRVRHQHGAKAAVRPFFHIQLELVEALEIPDDAAFFAVDFEAIVVLAPGREARPFDRAERAVFEFQQRHRRVVYVDRCLRSGA